MSSNSPMQQLSAAAIEYFEQGFTPIPEVDKRKHKKDDAVRMPCKGKGWKETKYSSAEEVEKEFKKYPEATGIGLMLGHLGSKTEEGYLVCVDLDMSPDPGAIRFSEGLDEIFLPPTRTEGRGVNPKGHWFYLVPDLPETGTIIDQDTGKRCKIELLTGESNHAKVTVSPSITAGEQVTVSTEGPIAVLRWESLKNRLYYLAAMTLLRQYWEHHDGRQTLSVPLAGSIARSIMTDVREEKFTQEEGDKLAERIDSWLESMRRIAHDGSNRRCRVVDQVRALREGRNAQGFPRLKQALMGIDPDNGEKDKELLIKWLGLSVRGPGRPPVSGGGVWGGGSSGTPDADGIERLEEFNHDHALMIIGGKAKVATFNEDGSYRLLSTMDAASVFSKLPAIFVTSGDNPPRPIPFFKYWMQWDGRKDIDQIVFDPDNGDYPETTYNTWRGWGVNPKKGDCSLYLEHIRRIIAGGNEHYGEWIIAWLADLVQNPTKRTGTAIVLRGEMGTGKGAFAQPILRLVGNAGLHLNDSSRISGRFNSQLADKLIVFADEAWYAGDKAHSGILKAIITEETIDIEHKGLEAVRMNNYMRLIMASNSDWVAPAGFNERRFAIFDVSDEVIQDRKYFNAIHRQMTQQGGDQALLDYLQQFDLHAAREQGVNPAIVPRTMASGDNAIMSADSVIQWLYSYAVHGEITRLTPNGAIDPETTLNPGDSIRPISLHEAYYLDWCNNRRGVRTVHYNTYSRRLTEFGFIRQGVSVTQQVVLPTVAKVQAVFCAKLGVRMFDSIVEEYAPDEQVSGGTPYDDEDIPF